MQRVTQATYYVCTYAFYASDHNMYVEKFLHFIYNVENKIELHCWPSFFSENARIFDTQDCISKYRYRV